MRIFITGATGLIGTPLVKELIDHGHEITALTRNRNKAQQKLGDAIRYCQSLNALTSLDGYDAVINLAGESIGAKCWTEKQKDLLCRSRWNITQHLSFLIKNSLNPPAVFVSGSAIGYYGNQQSNVVTESTPANTDFTHTLCQQWETLALESASSSTRVCLLRTGIVLSAAGGMLAKLALPFKLGMGAVMGTGAQYISWIHIQDMVGGIIHLLNTPNARGAFNFTAPNPITNREFSEVLAKTLDRPCIFRIPALPIKVILGEMSTLLLDGKRAMPLHLQQINYAFRFQRLTDALTTELTH